MDYRQKDWPEWLALAEFVVNNKVHTVTKVLPFIANYEKELRIGGDIRKKGKVEKAMEFVERIKKVHEEAGAVLKKVQENMKRQADRERKKTEDWKKRDRVLLSTKDLVFKETSKEISGLICRAIYHRGGDIHQCGQIMTANCNENPSGCECQSDSTI